MFLTSFRILRTDNTIEFIKNDIFVFCIDNGIMH